MANNIQFWLKDRNNKYLRLPVNPPEITLTSPFGINNIKVAGLGEISIPGERELKTVSFDSFFPRDYNPNYCEYSGFPKPKDWVKQIESWRDTRKNIRLIISGTDISIPVLISVFDIQPERAGHVGDIYYSIEFIEFKAPSVRKLADKNGTKKVASSTRPATNNSKSKTHTVKKGDSLWTISKTYYGKGSDFEKIYQANKSIIGNNKNAIKVGQKLVIP